MHYLRFEDLPPRCNADTIKSHLTTAMQFKSGALTADTLVGKHAVLLFEKPSLRTKLSFSIAVSKLGGQALYFAPQEVGLGEREAAADVAEVVARMADVAIVRTVAHATLDELAKHSKIPVINALSDAEHPCQALADLMTISEHFSKPNNDYAVVYVGDGNNVAVSLAWAVVKAGGQIDIITPPGYEVPQNAIAGISSQVRQSHSLEAVKTADVIYTDTWVSMGLEAEARERRAAFGKYQITAELLAQAPEHAILMHCLPAHEGDEIEAGLLRSKQSVCFKQAENRLWAQMALLHNLFKNHFHGE